MSEKKCRKCGQVKAIDQFYRNRRSRDGRQTTCKSCRKAYKKVFRAARSAHLRDYYRKYREKHGDAIRARQRKCYHANIEDRRARQRDMMHTEEQKAAHDRACRAWSAKNKEKLYAHQKVAQALKSGRLKKPNKCSACESGMRIEGHHEDYSKPYDVIWLCGACHKTQHTHWRYKDHG